MAKSLQGGDEIDDIFGCTTTDGGPPIAADTFNIAGGDRSNVGDSSVGLVIILLECITGLC